MSVTSRLAVCRARALNALVSPGVVLDFGCAQGLLARALAHYHQRVVAVDPSESNVQQAKGILADVDVDLLRAPLDTFEPPHGLRFDVIVIADTLANTKEPVALITRCAEWLTDDGVVIAIVDPAAGSDGDPAAQRAKAIESLRRDFGAAGMRVRTTGGIMFKPVPNSKMHEAPADVMAAYAELGDEAPELTVEVYAVALKK